MASLLHGLIRKETAVYIFLTIQKTYISMTHIGKKNEFIKPFQNRHLDYKKN